MDTTCDDILGGALRIIQPARGHRVGSDALILAAHAAVGQGDCVADLGAGVGSAGLVVAQKYGAGSVLLVEKNEFLADLACENAAMNGIRAHIACLDVAAPEKVRLDAGLLAGSADHIVMNPPYNEAGRHQISPDVLRAEAYVLGEDGLLPWLKMAAWLAKPRARTTMIIRPALLVQALSVMDGRFGSPVVRPVYPRTGEAAIRLVVMGQQGGRAELRILDGLVLHDESGQFTPEARAIHGL